MQNKNLKFIEEDFLFEEDMESFKARSSKIALERNDIPEPLNEPQILGIKIRLGNEPLVRNLKELTKLSGKDLPPEIGVLLKGKDLYTITHAIGVLRTQGRAKVNELQYDAEIMDLPGAQTIDLLPNTSFKTIWQINSVFEGAIKAGGNFVAKIPEELSNNLLPKYISLGGNVDLQLSSNTSFVGKFSCGLKLPIIQSSGIATNKCSWILNPDDNPLLGDQVLIQTLAVPKGTISINYKMKGMIKADKGIFWKSEQTETAAYEVKVNL